MGCHLDIAFDTEHLGDIRAIMNNPTLCFVGRIRESVFARCTDVLGCPDDFCFNPLQSGPETPKIRAINHDLKQ